MGLQNRRNPNWRNFRTPTQESQERKAIWMWACQVEHLTHDLGGMEYEVGFISLSQESTNFFSLNLEL